MVRAVFRTSPSAFAALRRALWPGVVWVALIAVFLAAPPAEAQQRDEALREIERTEQILDQARDLASSTGNSLARQYLDQAMKLQNLARSALSVDRLGDAVRLTRQARDRAFTAVRIAQQTGSAEFLRFMIERTDAVLDRIAPIVRGSRAEVSHRMIDAALEQQRRARDAVVTGRPRAALSLTFQARDRAMRALRLAEGAEGQTPDRAIRAVERTEELLTDAGWLLEAGDKSAEAYSHAMRTQSQARNRLEAEQYPAALRLTRRAREQLVRALNEADRPLEQDAVVQALERTRRHIERAAETASDERQQEAVEQARNRFRRAEQQLARGDLAACLAEVRAIRGVLERVGL
jgi:hypothetical protein